MIEDYWYFFPCGTRHIKASYSKKWCCRSWFHWATLFQLQMSVIPEKPSDSEVTGVRQELKNNTRCSEEWFSFLFSLKRAKQLSHGTAAKPVAPFHIFNLYIHVKSISLQQHKPAWSSSSCHRETLFLTQRSQERATQCSAAKTRHKGITLLIPTMTNTHAQTLASATTQHLKCKLVLIWGKYIIIRVDYWEQVPFYNRIWGFW